MLQIQGLLASNSTNNIKPESRSRGKGNSFATTITPLEPVENKVTTNGFKKQASPSCHRCSHAHPLEKCQQLKGKKHRDKINSLSTLEVQLHFGLNI